ncbi:hypothetical protein V5O48_001720 [Marasmius crinis-equi]|uniref:Amino acid transporter transmembrane domain-containing protein n=1 Tax=Marasmius crinis-equi TaxID=585013 RepID=A0ABR3FXN9_9AGAR
MSVPSSGGFIFGSATSGSSVRDAIASYRRAQYYVAGSTIASSGEELDNESDFDEEAGIGSEYSEDFDRTPRVDIERTEDDGLVGQFLWDEEDVQPVAPASVASSASHFPPSYAAQTQRNAEIAAETASGLTGSLSPANEVTPLLRPRVSFSQQLGGHELDRGRARVYGGLGEGDESEAAEASFAHRHPQQPVPRRSSTSSSKTHQRPATIGGQSTFGQTLFNSIAILLGIGLLSEPLAFAHAGWVTGTILIVLYGFLSCYTYVSHPLYDSTAWYEG